MPEIKVPKRMLDEGKQEDIMQNEVILYQLLHRQLNQLSAEAESVERKAVEAAATKQSLKELSSPNDLLMPIGSGCYVHGKFSNAKQVLVDIGAGILLPKKPADAEVFIADKEAQIAKLRFELQSEATKVVNEMNRIATKVKK
jgi:prefoldin alpha subunit